ncbi:MAG: ATP-binding protein [bacterium]|nr:ATP-binding protein [bacterium]
MKPIAIAFLIIPLFIFRIIDYFLCLPVWSAQRNRMLKQSICPEELINGYKTSLPFKHEMLYFPLPGLHRVIAAISTKNELGVREAVKHISHLYLFTFQQKEALTAFYNLWQDKEDHHRLLHYVLETKNIALLETLAKSNRLAELYLGLFARENRFPPQNMLRRINGARKMMTVEKGEHLHDSMITSLDAARQLLRAGSLKEFYDAMPTVKKMMHFPDDPDYFRILKNTASKLPAISEALKKIDILESLDTKRAEMENHKIQLENLAKSTASDLYAPFSDIWQEALSNCVHIMVKEIELMHSAAAFDISLLNKEISAGNHSLHFILINKGGELARDISVSLQSQSESLTVSDPAPRVFSFIESLRSKKAAFPVSVLHPGKATVILSYTFSDRTRENKSEILSFPITITHKPTVFKKIPNPYTAGPPLDSDSPLFIQRDDIYRFIDENIFASGRHHTIVCHGLRRTGKSSLLYRLEKQGFSHKRLVPINIDLQGIADEEDFYLTLSERIIQKSGDSSLQPVSDFRRFKQFLTTLAAHTGTHPDQNGKIFVLMLDEFEELQMRVEDGRISRTVFSNIRHLMQHQKSIIFLFCGTHKIEEMQADYWSIFFNTALYRRIGRLPESDAERLVRRPVQGALDFDDLAVQRILHMTGGQPYLIQLICRTLVDDLNSTKKRNDALAQDVDDAVEKIIGENNDNFSSDAWKNAGHLERMILSATAENLTQKRLEQINLEEILAKIEPHIKNFSREAAVDTLDKLTTAEILSEHNLNYRFTVNMTRKWIADRHPLRKVRA